MTFFKASRTLCKKTDSKPDKLRYVINENGKGRWVRPKPPMPIDYCEDVIY